MIISYDHMNMCEGLGWTHPPHARATPQLHHISQPASCPTTLPENALVALFFILWVFQVCQEAALPRKSILSIYIDWLDFDIRWTTRYVISSANLTPTFFRE